MRSSLLRCFVLTVLTLGLAWYTKVSVAQRHYEEGALEETSPDQVVHESSNPMQLFDA